MSTSIPNDPTDLLADLDFVRRIARQLCRDEHAAEDLVQETYASALRSAPDRIDNRRSWLATVTRNLFLSGRRSEQRRQRREQREQGETAVPTPDEVAAREQHRRLVVDAVMELPQAYRDVVLLRYFRGFDVAASARELGIREGNVRTRATRALAMLRERLDREHGGDRQRWLAALAPLAMPMPGDAFAAPAVAAANAKAAKAVALVTLLAFAAVGSWAVATSGFGATAEPTRDEVAGSSGALAASSGAPTGEAEPERATRADGLRTDATPRGTGSSTDLVAVGEVFDDEGRPLANAEVTAWATIGDDHAPERQLPLGTHVTGPDGRFRLPLAPVLATSRAAREQMEVFVRARSPGLHDDEGSQVLTLMCDRIVRDPSWTPFSMHLLSGAFLSGRVVDPSGRPVPEAKVAVCRDGAIVCWDETGGTGRFHMSEENVGPMGNDVVVVAAHPRFGTTTARSVRLLGGTELGQLELRPHASRIAGRVLWPDGRPAADIEVWWELLGEQPFDLESLPARLDAEPERARVFEHAHSGSTRTDPEGRFTLAHAIPGRYMLLVDEQEDAPLHEVTVYAGRTTFVERRYAGTYPAAQIALDVVDADGLPLPETRIGARWWRGAAAAEAARRFASEGPTAELLASAPSHDQFDRAPAFLAAVPDSFYLLEASCLGAGSSYGACRLEAGQHRGAVRIELAPRFTGNHLRVRVADPAGRPIKSAWVRLCRGTPGASAPILLAGLAGNTTPLGRIEGPWHELPRDGILRDLPGGPLTVEVLAEPRREGRHTVSRWPREIRQTTIAGGGTQELAVKTRPGAPLQLVVHATEVPESGVRISASLRPKDESIFYEHLTGDDGAPLVRLPDGVVRLTGRERYAPGSYVLVVETQPRLVATDPESADEHGRWRRTVAFDLDHGPVHVHLRAPR